jgi:hypothetical protein
MSEFLKGNYRIDVVIELSPADAEAASTEEFERKALARLGGSICYVSKKGFLWQGERGPGEGARGQTQPPAGRATEAPSGGGPRPA